MDTGPYTHPPKVNLACSLFQVWDQRSYLVGKSKAVVRKTPTAAIFVISSHTFLNTFQAPEVCMCTCYALQRVSKPEGKVHIHWNRQELCQQSSCDQNASPRNTHHHFFRFHCLWNLGIHLVFFKQTNKNTPKTIFLRLHSSSLFSSLCRCFGSKDCRHNG